MANISISKSIFRQYDIRGIVNNTLTEKDAYLIGRGFCSLNNNIKNIVVCRDGRLSSPNMLNSLLKGILETGVNVVDIGCGPTPMLYYASLLLNSDAGIMVTGSHNPPDFNGFKIVLQNKSFFGKDLLKLYNFIKKGKFKIGPGILKIRNISKDYENCLLTKSGPFSNLKVIWDCGNGATGEIISKLVKKLPGEHKVLFEKIDGSFPNHHPDPSIEKNLQQLKDTILDEGADLGIAFDGDGDRIGVLANDGTFVPGDILTAFLSGSILKKMRNKPIILDIKSGNSSMKLIEKNNGYIVISKTGHSLIKKKLKEINAPLAGEMSGHIFFNDNWFGFDDGIYAALRVIQEISVREGGLSQFLFSLPKSFTSNEIKIDCNDNKKFSIIKKIKKFALNDYQSSELLLIDGIRASSKKGWWLIRASNTQAALIARAEGSNQKNLKLLLNEISKYLNQAKIKFNINNYL